MGLETMLNTLLGFTQRRLIIRVSSLLNQDFIQVLFDYSLTSIFTGTCKLIIKNNNNKLLQAGLRSISYALS